MFNFHGNGDSAQNYFNYLYLTDFSRYEWFYFSIPSRVTLEDDPSHWNFDPVGGIA